MSPPPRSRRPRQTTCSPSCARWPRRRRCGLREPSACRSSGCVEPRHRFARRTTGGRVRRRRRAAQSRLTELMTGKRFDQAVTARDVFFFSVVVENLGLDATRRLRGRRSDLARQRDRQLDRLDRHRPQRTARTLFGMTSAVSGSILRLSGAPVAFASNRDAIRARSPMSPRIASHLAWYSRNRSPTTP